MRCTAQSHSAYCSQQRCITAALPLPPQLHAWGAGRITLQESVRQIAAACRFISTFWNTPLGKKKNLSLSINMYALRHWPLCSTPPPPWPPATPGRIVAVMLMQGDDMQLPFFGGMPPPPPPPLHPQLKAGSVSSGLSRPAGIIPVIRPVCRRP